MTLTLDGEGSRNTEFMGFILIIAWETRDMIQQVRVHSVLSEDQSSFPRPTSSNSQPALTQPPRNGYTLSPL